MHAMGVDRRYANAADRLLDGRDTRHPATGEWIAVQQDGNRLHLSVSDVGTPVLVRRDHRSIVRALHVFDETEVL